MGFLTCRNPITPTARFFLPFETIIEASSSLTPSRVKTAPWPLLKRGLSSSWVTANVTVSSAEAEEAVARGKEEGEVRKWCVRERIRRSES